MSNFPLIRELNGHDEIQFLEGAGPAGQLARLLSDVTDTSLKDVRALTLDEWEARLLDLRISIFGPRVQATIPCPECHEKNLLIFNAKDLLESTSEKDKVDKNASLCVDDILKAEELDRPEQGALIYLLSRSVGVDEVEANKILDSGEAEAALSDLEKQIAGLQLELYTSCTKCSHAFNVPFDIADFVHGEIAQRAAFILDDVHLIASVYSWGEAEILSLPQRRRQSYLSRIEDGRINSAYASAGA